jgi:hypothetical protein
VRRGGILGPVGGPGDAVVYLQGAPKPRRRGRGHANDRTSGGGRRGVRARACVRRVGLHGPWRGRPEPAGAGFGAGGARASGGGGGAADRRGGDGGARALQRAPADPDAHRRSRVGAGGALAGRSVCAGSAGGERDGAGRGGGAAAERPGLARARAGRRRVERVPGALGRAGARVDRDGGASVLDHDQVGGRRGERGVVRLVDVDARGRAEDAVVRGGGGGAGDGPAPGDGSGRDAGGLRDRVVPGL